MRAAVLGLVLGGCMGAAPMDAVELDTEGPLGMVFGWDGRVRAGAATVDVTPVIAETFVDADGNHEFTGCFDDPTGAVEGCGGEGFDDVDGDDWFDAVFIGGFGYRRPAQGVREQDGITARAVVLSYDDQYVALVGLDLVGLGHRRINAAADLLAAEGFDPDRLIVTSTHNHQGPDTMGLWGDPLAGVSGYDAAYQDRVTLAIVAAVKAAIDDMAIVELRVGAQRLRDRSPYFNGSVFGGHNPTAKMHGMVHDIRDPVVVSDQVLAVQGRTDLGETKFTLTSWSGHPEVRGGNNNDLSADWVGVTREVLEARYGGVALHLPESLGGMQSALGGDLPLVEEDGTHVYELCPAEVDPADEGCVGKSEGEPRTYPDGLPVPVWAPHDSWEFVTSHGWHIAEAAIDLLDAATPFRQAPIRVEVEDGYVPVRNVAYNLLGPSGIFDFGLEEAMRDTTLCPGAAEVTLGCLPFRTFRLTVGPIGLISAPGELVPELAWGLPTDDPAWVVEAADPGARGPASKYFPQHDADCDDVGFEACRDRTDVDDCDCLAIHAWPYTGGTDRPLLDRFDEGEVQYRAAVSMASTYLSYILPSDDTNRAVSLLGDRDGDHYEDTVTPAWDFADAWLEAQARIDARW
jgi:hypothetical protein